MLPTLGYIEASRFKIRQTYLIESSREAVYSNVFLSQINQNLNVPA